MADGNEMTEQAEAVPDEVVEEKPKRTTEDRVAKICAQYRALDNELTLAQSHGREKRSVVLKEWANGRPLLDAKMVDDYYDGRISGYDIHFIKNILKTECGETQLRAAHTFDRNGNDIVILVLVKD